MSFSQRNLYLTFEQKGIKQKLMYDKMMGIKLHLTAYSRVIQGNGGKQFFRCKYNRKARRYHLFSRARHLNFILLILSVHNKY